MHIVETIISLKNSSIDVINDSIQKLHYIFHEHQNSNIHVLLLITLITLHILVQLIYRLTHKLDEADKRATIALLAIQKYCCANTRALNELSDNFNNTTKDMQQKMRLMHYRVKAAYTGTFKHLDLNKIKRAPRTKTAEQIEQAEKNRVEHNAILREVIDEMLETEF